MEHERKDCPASKRPQGQDSSLQSQRNQISAEATSSVRPQLRKMLEAVKAGEVHWLTLYTPDRLSRESSEILDLIRQADEEEPPEGNSREEHSQ